MNHHEFWWKNQVMNHWWRDVCLHVPMFLPPVTLPQGKGHDKDDKDDAALAMLAAVPPSEVAPPSSEASESQEERTAQGHGAEQNMVVSQYQPSVLRGIITNNNRGDNNQQ